MKITRYKGHKDIGSKPGQNPTRGKTQPIFSYRIRSKWEIQDPRLIQESNLQDAKSSSPHSYVPQ